MDMVLVHQLSSEGFDKFPWMNGGRQLWDFIKGYSPILLTQVRESRFGRSSEEKLIWIKRELGAGIPVIFTPDSVGKGPHARAGDILIDDSIKHCADWQAKGGTIVLHSGAHSSIMKLKALIP